MYHNVFLLPSSRVCRAREQELDVGVGTTSCEKRWELDSSMKSLLSEHVCLWWWKKPSMGIKRNTSCIFETALGTGVGRSSYIPVVEMFLMAISHI